MKIRIKRTYFIEQLNDVLKAISPRTALPILNGIKLEATEETLVLTGSDSEISIEITIPTEVNNETVLEIESSGSVVLSARFFTDVIKKLSGDFVELDTNAQFLTHIRAGKSNFNLSGNDPNQYPLLPEVNNESSIIIPSSVLKTIINETNFAVSPSETRPVLTGVNWQFLDNEIKFTATDSHRLALRKLTDKPNSVEISNAIIPGKALGELNKIIDDKEDDVEVNFSQNQVLFKYGNMRFISRLLEGNYPDTSRLFPENYETKLTVNNSEFLHAIDRVSLLAREGGNNAIKMTIENGKVELSSNSPEIGNVEEDVNIGGLEGESLQISFNSKYMMDALRAVPDEEVAIEFFGTMKPFTIQSSNSYDVIQLILPIRTY
ncbi:DNA polymerase III subunit beta [Phocicoccus pinnipedialis]|uniref:Beta sliding clamp n=1 Tax=Phocicoccus pinnipedialis TaxID=110845 RepID=A0A6V7R5Q3_9BACL|nr:DNA polymerase III subunit beta [Jeotgalicoccus pinnipedialis]MBP1939723.1 DNA polymerase-3 subunit beta [Jeotgalicoccus pinnipedialis]CAD2072345.1 DNA polymerase III subunit beta [Jeotgalicoccus pinnipedialis]